MHNEQSARIDISEIVAGWDKEPEGIWAISPGVDWCKKGYKIQVEKDCAIGQGVILGDLCKLGEGCRVGELTRLHHGVILYSGTTISSFCTVGTLTAILSNVFIGDNCDIGPSCEIQSNTVIDRGGNISHGTTIREGCVLGLGCELGRNSYISKNCTLDNYCTLGSHSHVGPGARDVTDLGFVEGYRKCIAQVDGVAYIGAGCRWFTLKAALAHWSYNPRRVKTLALMESAKRIAQINDWKWE